MPKHYKTSVIIPSFQRSKELESCLKSIRDGTVQPTEIIVNKDKGSLVEIRNESARKAKGNILIFIDDDVTVSSKWLESILLSFETKQCAGVSGPAIIKKELRNNRDIFKFKSIKYWYDSIFLEGISRLPGHFTQWGAWTTGAADESCVYHGKVEFLEACNMSFERDAFWLAGGFDKSYAGVGDWSEPDICFRLRKLGFKLHFSQGAKVFHNVSVSGAYGLRLSDSRNRLKNYFKFSDKWIQPSWRLNCYKAFLMTYYAYKTLERYAHNKA